MRNGLQPNAVWYACVGAFMGTALGLTTQIQSGILQKTKNSDFEWNRVLEFADEVSPGSASVVDIQAIAVTAEKNSNQNKSSLAVRNGDTLLRLLQQKGVDNGEAHAAVNSMSSAFDPRDIRVGQAIEITTLNAPESDEAALDALRIKVGPGHDVVVVRDGQGDFVAQSLKAETVGKNRVYAGTIRTSLYEAAVEQGVPPQVLIGMIRLLSYDVDFQRDIRQNDSFEIMFEQRVTEDGLVVKNEGVEYASMTLRGKAYNIYSYEHDGGLLNYYNEDGKGIRKALMRTPINGARLSSSFGRRKHPVLGYTKMHRGVDFAAPRGTPIYAAGDGVIEKRRRWSSFGNYVRIRHGDGFSTAYAHMKSFTKGYSVGSRVKQGAVIGYVGTTGRSTGPHLHYEVLKGGAQVNPMKVRFPASKVLAGSQLDAFQERRADLDLKWNSLIDASELSFLNGNSGSTALE